LVDGGVVGGGFALMMLYTSVLCTGMLVGAEIPIRTLSPRISMIVIVILSLIWIDSFFLRDRQSIFRVHESGEGCVQFGCNEVFRRDRTGSS